MIARGQNDGMKIPVRVPVEQLVHDPFKGRREVALHGPFAALAQGADWRRKLERLDEAVLTENGIERISAPATIVSPPGTKRAGYAHEDTIWITVCGVSDDERDPDVLEDTLTVRTYDEYERHCARALALQEK